YLNYLGKQPAPVATGWHPVSSMTRYRGAGGGATGEALAALATGDLPRHRYQVAAPYTADFGAHFQHLGHTLMAECEGWFERCEPGDQTPVQVAGGRGD